MKFLLSVCLFLILLSGYSQPKTRRFPNSINNPSINVYAPFISLDGSMILFTSDYAELDPLVYYSLREPGDWKQPVELPKHLNTKLNFLKGYTLSPDGKTVYVSSIKSGGVGGYDIWSSEFKNNAWGELKNLFLPLNTKGHEASPTFTPDGTTMYFMRCDKIDYKKASDCKIFVARKKPNGVWDEPAELPAQINTGNSQTPRIMADGETLLFASDKIQPSTGGMDLFMTKLNNGVWSNPAPLAFVNTEKDDQYVSALANGRYLLKEGQGKFKIEVLEYLMPDDIRPRGVMKIEGSVSSNGAPVSSYVSVVDVKTQERIFSGRPGVDGSFFLFIKEGTIYELSVDPEDGSLTYYSKQYDLTKNEPLRNDKLSVSLKKISAGDELMLDAVRFKPYSSELETSSAELNRIARLLKSNTDMNFEIQVTLNGYAEDTTRVNPDLTEEIATTSTQTFSTTDTLGNITTRDSVMVKIIYHNNRTEQQANAVVEKFIAMGVNRSNLSISTNKKVMPDEAMKNTEVKIIARAKE
jgi:hypothetical protein